MKKIIITLLLLAPLLTFAQGDAKEKAYYFYGDQCPHCMKVNDYFQANGIYEKYDITKLEFSNPFNSRLLMKFGDIYEDPNAGSVPAVAFADKFIVGDQPIIDNFVKEIDAAENAGELPDPDKILVASPGYKQGTQPASESKGQNEANPSQAEKNLPGNKNKYFPVILLALVLAGGGVLVYVNRKSKE